MPKNNRTKRMDNIQQKYYYININENSSEVRKHDTEYKYNRYSNWT